MENKAGLEIVVEIQIDFRQNQRIRPHCEKSKLFSLLTGTGEFTKAQIDYIKQLGFTVKVYKPELPDQL